MSQIKELLTMIDEDAMDEMAGLIQKIQDSEIMPSLSHLLSGYAEQQFADFQAAGFRRDEAVTLLAAILGKKS